MRNKWWIVLAIFLLVVIGFLLYKLNFSKQSSFEGKIVFIESFRVFEAFEMKKEYDELLEKELTPGRLRLDSLGVELNAMLSDKTVSSTEINSKKMVYLHQKESYETRLGELSRKYTSQVYERLNSYIRDFGKQEHFRLILGASGEGNVMYVNEKADVTDALIIFINKKYLDN